MPTRLLKDSICTSETIDALSPELEVLFYRLIVQCDDYGRMDGRPSIIRSRCYPLRLAKVSDRQVVKNINALVNAGLIQVYLAQGKQYIQVTTWEKHQQVRAKRSKFPEPESICNQLISDDNKCPRNPIQSNTIHDIRYTDAEQPARSSFGHFQNVFLSETEYQKLVSDFGEVETKEKIEEMSNSFQSKKGLKEKYVDHYATLRNWIKRDQKVGSNGNSGRIVKEDTAGLSEEELKQKWGVGTPLR